MTGAGRVHTPDVSADSGEGVGGGELESWDVSHRILVYLIIYRRNQMRTFLL